MTTKLNHERLVRQRGRFKCENCNNFTIAQYAHIIPDSNGGSYDFNNLLYLCYECHRKFEPTLKKGELKKAHIKHMKKIKNRSKIDSLVTGIFDELQAGKEIVVHMGGITFINIPRIFQENPSKFLIPSFLEIEHVVDQLQISGLFKDENQKPLIFFSGTNFTLCTGDFWDVIRRPSELEFVNVTKKVSLLLRQNDDLSITIEGSLYLNNMQTLISLDKFILSNCATFIGNIIAECPIGLFIG